jgi:hypothetical protein
MASSLHLFVNGVFTPICSMQQLDYALCKRQGPASPFRRYPDFSDAVNLVHCASSNVRFVTAAAKKNRDVLDHDKAVIAAETFGYLLD